MLYQQTHISIDSVVMSLYSIETRYVWHSDCLNMHAMQGLSEWEAAVKPHDRLKPNDKKNKFMVSSETIEGFRVYIW